MTLFCPALSNQFINSFLISSNAISFADIIYNALGDSPFRSSYFFHRLLVRLCLFWCYKWQQCMILPFKTLCFYFSISFLLLGRIQLTYKFLNIFPYVLLAAVYNWKIMALQKIRVARLLKQFYERQLLYFGWIPTTVYFFNKFKKVLIQKIKSLLPGSIGHINHWRYHQYFCYFCLRLLNDLNCLF